MVWRVKHSAEIVGINGMKRILQFTNLVKKRNNATTPCFSSIICI